MFWLVAIENDVNALYLQLEYTENSDYVIIMFVGNDQLSSFNFSDIHCDQHQLYFYRKCLKQVSLYLL